MLPRAVGWLRSGKPPHGRRPSLGCEPLEERCLPSLTIAFDYSLDANDFFDTQAKRDLLQQAGQLLGARLADHLEAIVPAGINTWWATVDDPATGAVDSLTDLTVPADTVVIYAGGRALSSGGSGDMVGEGGPGGFSAVGTQDWLDTVQARGQAGALGPAAGQTDFAPAVGSVAFDTTANWYFGSSASGLGPGQTDFLSVALHELGHTLGLGTANSWQKRVSPSDTFTGPAAEASFGGPVPLDAAAHHWAAGTMSGGAEAAMDPSLAAGVRKLFTPLDWAGLQDVGWQVVTTAAPGVTVRPTSGLITTEQGGQATFTVVLNTVPTANVVIALSSSDPAAGTVAPAFLTFTPANALVPQTVTVTGADDGALQGDVAYTIVTHRAVSADVGYDGLDPADVAVTNLETDPVAPPVPPPPAAVGNVTALVSITRGKMTRRGGRAHQVLTLTNSGGTPLAGPVSVVVEGLGRGVRLLGRTGTAHAAHGSPFINLPVDQLLPGASVTLVLDLGGAGQGSPRYRVQVFAGPGGR
jgi:hypothetical protein